MAVSRHNEIVEVGEGEAKKKFRIVEHMVDRESNCIKRYLVPADTTEDDIPLGSRMLDERETEGHLARASRPDIINVGDAVRKKIGTGVVATEGDLVSGTVEAKLKNDRFRVRWDNGQVDRYEAKDLARIW